MSLWTKAFHVASVVTWIGGMLVMAVALHGIQSGYLRRLADAPGQEASALVKNSGALTIASVAIIAVMVVVKPF
jgi:uncharacterized membrane protein